MNRDTILATVAFTIVLPVQSHAAAQLLNAPSPRVPEALPDCGSIYAPHCELGAMAESGSRPGRRQQLVGRRGRQPDVVGCSRRRRSTGIRQVDLSFDRRLWVGGLNRSTRTPPFIQGLNLVFR